METVKANRHLNQNIRRLLTALTAMIMILALPVLGTAESAEESKSDWVTFLLICNEGMNNEKGNAGNTEMIVSLNPSDGSIRLCMFTWDTFINYEGYDVPQRLDMPYRNGGAEETLKVFNANFNTNIDFFMSLNYLNLASLIDSYGSIPVDITRAERNALNGMVGSKKNQLQAQAGSGLLSQLAIDLLASEYYLTEYGPETELNGLQAVGFGWLQYDSVYNCCEREVEVIAGLFKAVGKDVTKRIAFYTDESGEPDKEDARYSINLDHMTDEDYDFIKREMAPIFEMAYHNLDESTVMDISIALAHVAYQASRQGVNIFDSIEKKILPLEAKDEYDIIAGAQGHVIDLEKNVAALNEFLYK